MRGQLAALIRWAGNNNFPAQLMMHSLWLVLAWSRHGQRPHHSQHSQGGTERCLALAPPPQERLPRSLQGTMLGGAQHHLSGPGPRPLATAWPQRPSAPPPAAHPTWLACACARRAVTRLNVGWMVRRSVARSGQQGRGGERGSGKGRKGPSRGGA